MTHIIYSTDQLSPVFLGFLVSFCVINRYVQFWGCFLFSSVIQDISNLEHKDRNFKTTVRLTQVTFVKHNVNKFSYKMKKIQTKSVDILL